MLTFYGILFTIVIGIVLHFTYEWSGQNLFVAFLAPTNESVFEHLKLLFTPYLLWTLAEYEAGGYLTKSFIPAKTFSVLAGMLTILLLFYFYTAIYKKHFLWADITIFVFSVFTAFGLSHFLMPIPLLSRFAVVLLSDTILIATCLAFAIFTVYPPKCQIFRESQR